MCTPERDLRRPSHLWLTEALHKQEVEEKVKVSTTWLGDEGTPSTYRVPCRGWEGYCLQALKDIPAPFTP